MSFARGERVYIDVDSEGKEELQTQEQNLRPSNDFISEIKERAPAKPPTAPSLKSSANGFPIHKKRTPRVSAFKQQRAAQTKQAAHPASVPPLPSQNLRPVDGLRNEEDERKRIDEENKQRVADMSPEEIEQERKELFEALSPSLIQRLLARANIDEGSNERDLGLDEPPPENSALEHLEAVVTEKPRPENRPVKKVTFDASTEHSLPPTTTEANATSSTLSQPALSSQTRDDSTATSLLPPDVLSPSIHFPKPPQPPDLNPDDPDFLDNLHEKYFPDLSYDPSRLSWMTPVDGSDTKSPYHPSQVALEPSEIRFSFKGELLAPSVAREIPVTKGLHHHGEAPEAAGYTIPELARLARSAVASQRCMAYQTLGRILFRLGKGEFGQEGVRYKVDGPAQIARDPNHAEEDGNGGIVEDEDAGAVMARGLWECVEEGRVVETLTEEANREKGHLTARTYAQEALWNWRRGGGRKRRAV